MEIGAKILIEMEVVFIVKSSLTLLLHILNDIFSNYYTFKQTYLLQVNLFFFIILKYGCFHLEFFKCRISKDIFYVHIFLKHTLPTVQAIFSGLHNSKQLQPIRMLTYAAGVLPTC